MATETFTAFDSSGNAVLIKGRIVRFLPDTVSNDVKAAIRSSISVPGTAEGLTPANNLSDVSSAATSRSNLSVQSIDEFAQSLSGNMGQMLYYDGVNDYGEIADADIWTFSDGNGVDQPFSVCVYVDFFELGATEPIICQYGAVNRSWRILKTANDKIRVTLVDGGADECYAESPAITQTGLTHIAIVFTASSAVTAAADDVLIYVNSVSVTPTATNNAIYGGMSNASQVIHIAKDDSDFFRGHIKRIQVYNFALSAAQVAQVMRQGSLGYAYSTAEAFGGTYASSFQVDENGHTASGGAVTGNEGPLGGENYCLKLVLDSASSTHYVSKNAGATVGEFYRISFDYYLKSTNSNLNGIKVRWNNGSEYSELATTQDAWTRLTFDAIATDASYEIYGFATGVQTFQDAGGDDELWIRNIKVTQLGLVADLHADNYDAAEGILRDASGNAQNATNNGATLVGARNHLNASTASLTELPTSASGLSAGSIWNDSGTLKIV
jgi:hypothetical protein